MPGGWEWLIILVVLVVLFGAKRLPELARSVGQSARVFKGEMKGMRDDETQRDTRPTPPAGSTGSTAAPAPPAALPSRELPPAGRPVDGTPGEPSRHDPVRPDTDR